MDRFIDVDVANKYASMENLKSSLDRFIALKPVNADELDENLKSSLDRFIVEEMNDVWYRLRFKIQFG